MPAKATAGDAGADTLYWPARHGVQFVAPLKRVPDSVATAPLKEYAGPANVADLLLDAVPGGQASEASATDE